MQKKIWIDMINPSHPLFFRPLINELKKNNSITITLRNRGETVQLAELFGLHGIIYGRDYEDPVKKIFSFVSRTFSLSYSVKRFDYTISFENPMSIFVSKLRGKKSILLLDNDLKYKNGNIFFQTLESKIKLFANTIIIPRACEETLKSHRSENKLKIYDGFKEDFYIADYHPDGSVLTKLPFQEYIVIRGEASNSFYVNKKQSILPQLFKLFTKENINILFLPRDKGDFTYPETEKISILKEPINGLDLIYYSNAVLTGSGTMAREAACMGKTAISFYPSDELLSVDTQLIKEGKIFHSRDPAEIVAYVLSNFKKKKTLELERSKKVKKEVLSIIKTCLQAK
jgi:predicted glycosyltransferase